MKVYKPLKLSDEFDMGKLERFASFFSKDKNILFKSDKKYVCVNYNPDVYFENQNLINDYFSENLFTPLIMTNYKFVFLLLMISNNKNWTFTDFSFKNEGEEGESDKEIVHDLIESDDDSKKIASDTNVFLKESGQKIASIELRLLNRYKIKIFTNGTLAISDNLLMEKNMNLLLGLVEFLFTGEGLSDVE